MLADNDNHPGRKSGLTALCLGIVVLVVSGFWLSPSEGSDLGWYNLLVPSVWALFAAALVMAAVILIMASITGLRSYGVSVGMLGNVPIYVGRTWSLYVGWFPIADIDLPHEILHRKGIYWWLTGIPSIVMVVLGGVLMEVCRNEASGMTGRVPIAGITAGSLLALFALACIANAVILELTFFNRLKDIYPKAGCIYTLSELLIFCALLYLFPLFSAFFKDYVVGLAV